METLQFFGGSRFAELHRTPYFVDNVLDTCSSSHNKMVNFNLTLISVLSFLFSEIYIRDVFEYIIFLKIDEVERLV